MQHAAQYATAYCRPTRYGLRPQSPALIASRCKLILHCDKSPLHQWFGKSHGILRTELSIENLDNFTCFQQQYTIYDGLRSQCAAALAGKILTRNFAFLDLARVKVCTVVLQRGLSFFTLPPC